jgi:hypothetical protein
LTGTWDATTVTPTHSDGTSHSDIYTGAVTDAANYAAAFVSDHDAAADPHPGKFAPAGEVGGAGALPWITGFWYASANGRSGAYTAGDTARDRLFAAPIYVPSKINVNQIGYALSGGATSPMFATYAIYDDVGGAPGNLLAQTASIDMNGQWGFPSHNITPVVDIGPGWYWLAVVRQGTGSFPSYLWVNGDGGFMNIGTPNPYSVSFAIGYWLDGITGALPVAWGNVLNVAAQAPVLHIRPTGQMLFEAGDTSEVMVPGRILRADQRPV